MSWDTLKALFQLNTFQLQKTLHQVNIDTFRSPYLVQLFDRYATYNGSDPYQTSGMMTLIQHLESAYGTFIPKKGMVSITEALYALAKRLGVTFTFDAAVEEIVTDRKGVSGVRVNGATQNASLVVSNMDVFLTYKQLLPKALPPLKKIKTRAF